MLEQITKAVEAVLYDYMGRIKTVETYPYSGGDASTWLKSRNKWEAEGCEVIAVGNAGKAHDSIRLIVFEGKGEGQGYATTD